MLIWFIVRLLKKISSDCTILSYNVLQYSYNYTILSFKLFIYEFSMLENWFSLHILLFWSIGTFLPIISSNLRLKSLNRFSKKFYYWKSGLVWLEHSCSNVDLLVASRLLATSFLNISLSALSFLIIC